MMAEKPTHEEINQKEMLTKASLAQWWTTFLLYSQSNIIN